MSNEQIPAEYQQPQTPGSTVEQARAPYPSDRPADQRLLYAEPSTRLGCLLLEYLLVIVTLGVGYLIWALTLVGKGQTPAKKILGLQVVDTQTHTPVGFAKMFFVRGLLASLLVAPFIFSLTLGVLVLMPMWDKQRRTVYEAFSGTLVVRTK